MIPKRYDKFGTVKILTVSRKQWYKNFENPSKFIFIVHPLTVVLIVIIDNGNATVQPKTNNDVKCCFDGSRYILIVKRCEV